MKAHPIVLLVPFLFLFISTTSLSQSTESMPGIDEPVSYDKLYLHTDRDYYFLGDTIWFKAYYLDGQSHRMLPGIYNMHAELIDKKGKKIQKHLLYLEDGRAPGRMCIPDTLEPGQYLLRAYSEIQDSLGENHFFHKILEVSKVRSTLDKEVPEPSSLTAPEIDLAFLPEGGILLEGRMNTVGIKTIDKNGRSIVASGEILNQKGAVVSTFETSCKGMDTIHFYPLPREKYQIRLQGYPGYHEKIRNIRKNGVKIEFCETSEKELKIQIASNSKLYSGKNYLFAIMHRGSIIFQKHFILKEAEFPVRVSSLALPAGINRLVLLDENLIPVSERLIFSKNMDINRILIEADQESYSTRSPVTLHLSEMEELGGMAWSSLSLSVVAANAVEDQKKALDIRSWLLINSELKGHIESPSEFFLDDENHSSNEKLDFLMLTQGWSNYLWNSMPKQELTIDMKQMAGITLSGTVRKAFSKKPVIDGLVVCHIFNSQGHLNEQTTTDELGKFTFQGLYFPDTAALFLQGYNKKGKLYTEVFLDSIYQKGPPISVSWRPLSRQIEDFPVRLYQQQFFSEQALRDYSLKTGAILLDEVTVINKFTPVSDGHFRFYAKPMDSYKITEKDYHYLTVFDYLNAHVSGLRGPPISFTAGASAKLLLLDGVQTEFEILQAIPMSDVDVIEFIKHFDVTNVAMFGTKGAGGIISVFTKSGGEATYNPYVQGTLSERIMGFSSYREFYSPAYTPENIDSEKPDRRITLYWNPDITTREGRAKVSFFTSDDFSHYKVIVEGITNTGEVCLGNSEIRVASEHAKLFTR
jgi:hypothetical protein